MNKLPSNSSMILTFSVGSDEYWLIFQTSGTVTSKEINAIHTSHDTNLMKRVKSNDFSLVIGIYNNHLKYKAFQIYLHRTYFNYIIYIFFGQNVLKLHIPYYLTSMVGKV